MSTDDIEFSNQRETSRAQHEFMCFDIRSDDNDYEFESQVRKDLPIPCRGSLGSRRTSLRGDQDRYDLASTAVSEAASGGSWYHEAAIQESKPVRER